MWREAAPAQPLDPAEISFFADIQKILSRRAKPLPHKISNICAVDSAYRDSRVVAVASVFNDGRLGERGVYEGWSSLPYVSGLFYLREGPFVVEAVRRLKAKPQLVCFDAHGSAHPRSAGLATVCGMVLGIPSIGIAKSLLVGREVYRGGNLGKIVHNGKAIGFVTHAGGIKRYWSTGYSVGKRKLASLIRGYATICLKALADSDRTAKELARTRSRVQGRSL